MTRSVLLATLAVVALAATACNRSAVAPTPQALDAPAAAVVNGPANPGNSPVMRMGTQDEISTVDLAKDLVAAYYDPDEVCASGNSDLSAMPVFALQVITLPLLQATLVHLQSADKVPVVVYRWSDVLALFATDPTDEEMCTFLTSAWLYQGTAGVNYGDANATFEPPRSDSWGWTANGAVTDQAGNAFRYHNQARYVVNHSVGALVMLETIDIRPTAP